MKNYNEFNYQLNEGFISNVIRRIIEFFLKIFGKKAFGYIALYLNNKGKIHTQNQASVQNSMYRMINQCCH